MVVFKLPDLGEGLEDAEILAWLVAEGDEVALNQPIAEVDTAKAQVEIPSPFAGKVLKLHASSGDVVKVGAPLVTFEVQEKTAASGSGTSVLVGYGVDQEPAPKRRRRLSRRAARGVSATPAAPPVRRLARDLGVDLGSVSASGPGGRISREDVLRASEATPTRPLAQGEERIPISGVRRLVAQKMAKSASEIPHVTTFLTVDATSILAVRDAAQARTPDVKITPLAVVARAFVEILKDHPKLNASLDDDSNEIVLKRYYHLGIATDTDRGLIVPVVRDADTRDIGGLAAEINRLASLVRDMMATPEDVTGSTVTVSNVGSFGAEFGTPIINLPESSILALGVIRERPTVREGEIAVSLMVTLSLSFDHRIMDGAEAGRALLDLRKLLESSDALKKL